MLTVSASVYGQSNPVQNSLIIQGSAGTPYNWPTLFLDKNNSTNPAGLSFSYSEDTNGNGTGIQFLNKSGSQWQWQMFDGSNNQLQMALDSNNKLTLYDLSTPSPNPVIIIDPHGSSPGITINGQPVLTQANGSFGFGLVGSGGLVVASSGYVGIGNSNPDQQLTITGNFEIPTTTASAGAIYQNGTPLIHTYGNQNDFFGTASGNFTMTGAENVGIGTNALEANTTGSSNIAVGAGALALNQSGFNNVALGPGALASNASGTSNVAIGAQALFSSTWAPENMALGYQALYNTQGQDNVAFGAQAGANNVWGTYNFFLGAYSGPTIVNGSGNVIIGAGCDMPSDVSFALNIDNMIYGVNMDGYGNTVSSGNIGIGIINPVERLHVSGGNARVDGVVKIYSPANTNADSPAITLDPNYQNSGVPQILINNQPVATVPVGSTFIPVVAVGQNNMGSASFASLSTGAGNTALGNNAMSSISAGSSDTAVGNNALQNLTTGTFDTAIGNSSLANVTTGQSNVGIGNYTLTAITADTGNTAVGDGALYQTMGSGNVALGEDAGRLDSGGTANNNIYIGNQAGTGGYPNLSNATAIGYAAQVTQNNSMALGGTGVNAVNVGIGTTAPVTTLEVNGMGQFDGSISVFAPNAQGTQTTPGATPVIVLDPAGTSQFNGPVQIAPQGDILMGQFGN